MTYWKEVGCQYAITVVIGITFGISVAYTLFDTEETDRDIPFFSLRDFLSPKIKRMIEYSHDERAYIHEDRSVADALAKKVRVLCWVTTRPGDHYTKAVHVRFTWGKRCDRLIFISAENDTFLPAVKLPLNEDANTSWAETRAAFQYLYDYHLTEADWFLKADDVTYVVVENLRHLLAEYNSSESLYFGDLYKFDIPKKDHRSAPQVGSGFVLSRAALDAFVTKAMPAPWLCRSAVEGGDDRVEMGKCLTNVDVKTIDTRDSNKQGRFFKNSLVFHWRGELEQTFWYWKEHNFRTTEGQYCCSELAVTFHDIKPWEMYEFEYLLYHFRIYGITKRFTLPKILTSTLKNFLTFNKI